MSEESTVKTYGKKIVLTTWTILIWIMRSPTMLMLVIGFGVGYYFGFQSGKGSVLPRAVRAEQALVDFKVEIGKALEQAAIKQVFIRDEVRRQYDDQNIKMDAINLRLRDLRAGVSLCASDSVMPIPTATPGARPRPKKLSPPEELF